MSFEDDFRDAVAGDMAEVLGEPVTYTPKGKSARTLNAIVKRPTPAAVSPTSHYAGQFEIYIPRASDPALGLDSIDVGGDTVAFADYPGRADRSHTVAQILSTVGGWTLRLR